MIELEDGLVAIDPSKVSNIVIRAEAQGQAAILLAAAGRMAEAGNMRQPVSIPWSKSRIGRTPWGKISARRQEC